MSDSFFDVEHGKMNWRLSSLEKETNHPFLNFYVLHYDVLKEGVLKEHRYFLASRKEENDLRPVIHKYSNPDAVVIGLYRFREGKLEILLTKQFRPAIGNYVFSVPAGLIEGKETLNEAALREAKEEVGASKIENIEVLTPFSPTSSGLTDECNAFLMAEVKETSSTSLEEFEDINSKFVPIEECLALFKDPKYIIPLHVRIWLMYMAERFKAKEND